LTAPILLRRAPLSNLSDGTDLRSCLDHRPSPSPHQRHATATVNARMVGEEGRLRLSRINAARFLLSQVDDATWLHKAPLISA
jgi:hypothetical protein